MGCSVRSLVWQRLTLGKVVAPRHRALSGLPDDHSGRVGFFFLFIVSVVGRETLLDALLGLEALWRGDRVREF